MSKKSNLVDEGIALISIHHITPSYEDEIIRTCDLLEEIGIDSYSLLLTPFYKMKRSNTFEKHELFSSYLSSLGQEISLCGYAMQSKSGSESEFQRMSQEQMASRIRLGFSFMKKAFETRPVGFVPPMWVAPSSLVGIVKQLKFKYCTIGNTIYCTDSGSQMSTTYHIIGKGDRSLSKSDAYLELELGGPVQIALHPNSFFMDDMYDLIVDMKDRLGYRFIGYSDYLLEKQPR